MLHIDRADPATLSRLAGQLETRYAALCARGLKLDLTRGKPGPQQLDLSAGLETALAGNYRADDGTDLRNYGGLDGIAEARQLFAPVLQVAADDMLIGGNSSLTLMYQCLLYGLYFGFEGAESAWHCGGKVRFICPVPGYDRHFNACIHLGIELLSVPMTGTGPDMDAVEALIDRDPSIRGMWCVPRFSNPTGAVYDATTVERCAALGKRAAPGFRLFWDDAYAVHALHADAPPLAPVYAACKRLGTENNVLLFGSTSKITYAGSGVAFMAASALNLRAIRHHLGFASIGPDKINQKRHVAFLRDHARLLAHMEQHAMLLRPRFQAVLDALERELGGTGMGSWESPQGGYFIGFDTRPGLAREVVSMADAAGVKLTPAGATFPYGVDPEDRNIRIAPSFPSLEEIERAMEVFVVCVQLASVRQRLAA
ncbi:MAG: aminotransferase class I/II-fold pyridoxal phosphate-dependent enzyme [Pseudomonadales bacterium]|nr:aminotransferase class I/II-fold pyridoxal phosphate-dependent enzyme [Pseudomonadales bacterium]